MFDKYSKPIRFVFISCGLFVLAIFVLGHSTSARATPFGAVDVSGSIGVETRIFTQSPKHENQESDPEASLIFNPEFRYTKGRNKFTFIPFYRQDSRDDERTHFDIREAYWLYNQGDWEISAGLNKVFWGVTESRHLVDIINQTDFVEDLDGEDKLGQPMISLTKYNDWGQLDFYALTGFRERTFAGSRGRLRGATLIDTDKARYDSGAKEKRIDFAARYSHYFGNWDIGVSHFYGTGREPRFVMNESATKFVPYYDLINQTGLDVQYTKDAWLWKFEGIMRKGQGKAFAAATGGLEYTFYQVLETAADIGLLMEYSYDGRDAAAPPAGFDGSILGGLRLGMNDIQDTQALVGLSVKPETGEIFYNLETQRRIGDQYQLQLRARLFTGADAGDFSYPIVRDDYVQIRFSRYF